METAVVGTGLFVYFLTFIIVPIISDCLQRPAAPSLPPAIPSPANSSSRDVIFLYGTQYHSGVELALRSLHATGCRARVVLFMSPTMSLTSQKKTLLLSLNVEVVPNCGARPPQSFVVPHMTRYHYEYDWLTNHTGEIDRVLHSDAYDIFFQSDPFADAISRDYLSFVVEPHFIRGCGWNLHWFEECFGTVSELFKNSFIICSGSIAGNAEHYRKLVGLMLNTTQWKSCYHSSKDQPILNFLVWSGAVRDAGIRYRFVGCDGGLMTLQWCVVNKVVRFDDAGQVLSPSDTVPAYLHQYPRIEGLASILFKRYHM
jgi:hypothetical protein